MADYCTLVEVKANPDLGISSTDITTYDSVLSALITAASRLIDHEVGKEPDYFYPSTSDEVRYYTGDGESVYIDEAVSITSLAVSEGGEVTSTGYTSWAATDYHLLPFNYAAKGEPIRCIEIDSVNGNQYSFYGYPKGVKVTGIFGYSATPPAEINRACIAQTVYMFMQDKQAYQTASAGADVGSLSYTDTLHPTVAEILRQYKNKAIV